MFAPHVVGALVPAVPASLKNTAFTLWIVKKPRLLTATVRQSPLQQTITFSAIYKVSGKTAGSARAETLSCLARLKAEQK
jgi:hypothetical protein